MGAFTVLGIILGPVIFKTKIGAIIVDFFIGMIMEYKVGWPFYIFI